MPSLSHFSRDFYSFFFFYDILVYSKGEEEHLSHLRQVMEVLWKNHLYAKLSKCHFGVREVEYLGHIVTAETVKANPNKVASMLD